MGLGPFSIAVLIESPLLGSQWASYGWCSKEWPSRCGDAQDDFVMAINDSRYHCGPSGFNLFPEFTVFSDCFSVCTVFLAPLRFFVDHLSWFLLGKWSWWLCGPGPWPGTAAAIKLKNSKKLKKKLLFHNNLFFHYFKWYLVLHGIRKSTFLKYWNFNVVEMALKTFHFVPGLSRTPLLFILRYFTNILFQKFFQWK